LTAARVREGLSGDRSSGVKRRHTATDWPGVKRYGRVAIPQEPERTSRLPRLAAEADREC